VEGDVSEQHSAVPPGGDADDAPEQPLRPILTRREFLVGAGAGVAVGATATGVALSAQSGTQLRTPVLGPGNVALVTAPGIAPTSNASGVPAAAPVREQMLTLKVNGQTYRVAVQARATLADVLRYQLGLTGTKIGCNRAECGACTVVLNGRNVYSCTTMAFAAEGKDILTVEGLAHDASSFDGLHPIQQGFVIKDAEQCAFCMSGQMMSAYALLQVTPKPTEAEVRRGLSGNICRCGNYNHLWDAVAWAADHLA
jgi:aerobic-type carbon monoxide dehydrogenase small subunit (CoxS/CutS family)